MEVDCYQEAVDIVKDQAARTNELEESFKSIVNYVIEWRDNDNPNDWYEEPVLEAIKTLETLQNKENNDAD